MPKKRSLSHQLTLVKYTVEVPPASSTASMRVAAISARARSTRATRSGVVIGRTRSRIDASAAIDGGRPGALT